MFIAFEGPTGVGKTTLAKATSTALSANFFADPFTKVRRFGSEEQSDGLATEAEFLFHRSRQLQEIARILRESLMPVVADWDLRKSHYFARRELDDYDYGVLMEFAELVALRAPRPNVLVIVQSPPGIVLDRIARRGRPYELQIKISDIEHMLEEFNKIADSVEKTGGFVLRFENRDGIADSVNDVIYSITSYFGKTLDGCRA